MSVPTREAGQLKGHEGAVHVVAYNSTGQYCLSGGQDRRIVLWNPSTKTPIQVYKAHGYEVLDVSVLQDNSQFVSCGGDRTVYVWDVATGHTIKRFVGHLARINSVSYNQDGSVIASGSFDSTVRLWDCKSNSRHPIQILDEAADGISSVQIRGHEIITGSVDCRVRAYDLRMGRVVSDMIGASISSIRQSKDDNTILVSTLDSKLRLMDKSNGEMLRTFSGHIHKEYRLRSVFGPRDETIISGSEDGRICIWDIEEGKLVYQLENGHDGRVVTCVAVHPRGTQMLSCGVNGTIQIWD